MATPEETAIITLQAFIDQSGGGANLTSGALVSDFAYEMILEASEIIQELYTDVIRIKDTTYTRANPWEEPSAVTSTYEDLYAAVFGQDPLRREALVEAKRKYVLIAANDIQSIVPDVDKIVEIGGKDYAISMVEPVPAGTNRALYIMHIELG